MTAQALSGDGLHAQRPGTTVCCLATQKSTRLRSSEVVSPGCTTGRLGPADLTVVHPAGGVPPGPRLSLVRPRQFLEWCSSSIPPPYCRLTPFTCVSTPHIVGSTNRRRCYLRQSGTLEFQRPHRCPRVHLPSSLGSHPVPALSVRATLCARGQA